VIAVELNCPEARLVWFHHSHFVGIEPHREILIPYEPVKAHRDLHRHAPPGGGSRSSQAERSRLGLAVHVQSGDPEEFPVVERAFLCLTSGAGIKSILGNRLASTTTLTQDLLAVLKEAEKLSAVVASVSGR
jgi:hypothetical protein